MIARIEAKINSENKLTRRLWRFCMLGAGGILTALTLVFPVLGIIEWITLIPSAIALIVMCRDTALRRRGLYGYGFFFFMCFNFVNFHWFLSLYPLDFVSGINELGAIAVLLLGSVGLSALQASGGAFLFVAFGEIVRGTLAKRFKIFGALAAAALWAILEWWQTLGWTGVPWGRLSIGQTEWLIGAQSASLLGCCFVTFLIVVVNFFAAYAILYAEKRRVFALLSAGVFLANTALGVLLFLTYKEEGDAVKMSAVQGNISSQDKWSSELRYKTYDIYEQLTVEAVENGAEVVIWPETVVPYDINVVAHTLSGIARRTGATILVGVFTSNDDEEEFNSIVAILPDGTIHDTVYSKRHLVPFGEYVPYREFFEVVIPPLTEISMLSYDLTAGEGAQIIELDEVGIGSLICYDSIYDELSRKSTLAGAEVLAISTNDSWFLDSAEVYMHNAQGKLRAIENGRWIVRSANTGVSSIISPRGEQIDMIDALKEGQITAEVYKRDSLTLYTRIGNLFVYICIAAILAWAVYEKVIPLILFKRKA